MKKLFSLTLMFLLVCGTAYAIVPVYNDIWDISQGAVVDSSSSIHYGSDARNMFGGGYGWIESGNTLFDDFRPAGYTHYIEWHTPSMVDLTGFNLFAASDGGSNARSFQEFRLYYKNGLNWMRFYTFDPTHPYGAGPQNNELALAVNGLSINAEYFRAEFDQYGYVDWASGPRIYELDGFSQAPVPEPGSLWMLGTGLLGLLGLRRKNR